MSVVTSMGVEVMAVHSPAINAPNLQPGGINEYSLHCILSFLRLGSDASHKAGIPAMTSMNG